VIVATMPCRNEGWILGLSLRALLMWVDHVVILDHASTDETPEIICEVMAEHPGRVTCILEDSPVWEEMRHRQWLLDSARELGASHVVLVDADEVLTGDLLPVIRRMVYACPPAATMQLPWLCLRDSKDQVHVSGVWGEQNISTAFKDAPHLHWSSESRGKYDFHHRPPMGRSYAPYSPVHDRSAGLMHLQFANSRRLRAKQALYQATEVLRWPGRETPDQIRRKYSLSVYGRDHAPALNFDLAQCPARWWDSYRDLMPHYSPDAEPWQEAELRRLVDEHGRERFAGLDFFGVA
jgi:hypothetical protein